MGDGRWGLPDTSGLVLEHRDDLDGLADWCSESPSFYVTTGKIEGERKGWFMVGLRATWVIQTPWRARYIEPSSISILVIGLIQVFSVVYSNIQFSL